MAPRPKYIDEFIERQIRIEEKLDRGLGDIAEIHDCVFGDGEPERGLAFRVVQNEDFRKRVNKLIWLAVGAVVSGVGGLVFSIFS